MNIAIHTPANRSNSNVYDFENHLVKHGDISIVYDGDGNRVSKTKGTLTTNYLVDTNNPTGYAQVLEEIQDNKVARTYAYGLNLISENQQLGTGNWQLSYYGYDGHGSVRYLTSPDGNITDTYDYDAFGNLINSTGSTQNNYLYAGEQFDPDLGLYYNRARYLDVRTGRFWGMDTYAGEADDPSSLNTYHYASNDPTDEIDPTGNAGENLNELNITMLGLVTVSTMAIMAFQPGVRNSIERLAEATTGFAGETYDGASEAAGRMMTETELALQAAYMSTAEAISTAKERVKSRYRKLRKKLEDFNVVPIPERVLPEVARHITVAQVATGFVELTRVDGAQARLNRRMALRPKLGRSAGPGRSWDEYPFASSLEGGANASVTDVPLRENLIQGGIIAASYYFEKINPGDKFFVIVIPTISIP